MKLQYTPEIFSVFPNLVATQSTRQGGVSEAPFGSLNLSFRVGDAETYVRENRRRFYDALRIKATQLATSKQVHGDRVLYAPEPGDYDGFDALVTNRRGVMLAVSVADCTPVLLFDTAQQVVAAIHAGWRGTVAGITFKTLELMQAYFGTRPSDCVAFIGACIDAHSYEVDADVADYFPDNLKRYDAERSKFFIDLKMANHEQLSAFGIPSAQIEVSPYCTVLHNDVFFSHRAEQGKTGRMLAVIGMNG